ncbi:MAG: zinc-ribbon domain-containing protein [Myxococcales bacterium]|nr:zinc-ribbon domain-containing protein [Myxococcales bacterium]
MDVSCSRCGTEYEFDDALVSDRGTTVKCTNCGHQFKVHPADGPSGPERWVVRTTSGRELVYTSLRDLQKGISQRQIGPEDLLSRGGGPPRALSSIAELEAFFRRNSSAPPPAGKRSTSSGLGNRGPLPPTPHPPRTPSNPPPAEPAFAATTRRSSVPPPKPARNKPPIPGRKIPSTPPPPAFAAVDVDIEPDPPTIPRNPMPDSDLSPPSSSLHSSKPSHPEARLTPPSNVRIQEEPLQHTPTPTDVSDAYRSYEETGDARFMTAAPPSRRQRSRWIVGVVLLGALVLVGLTVGRDYLKSAATEEPANAASDARVATLVERGNKALADGDFEGAKEQYDKASALGEHDAGVLVAQARLEAARADIVWLKLRLLDPSDDELVQITHRELAVRVRKSLSAAAAAEAAAPEDASVIRARVDALRLQGELQKARAHVASISSTASQPETAYVLAALDMAEKEPNWSSIVDRLRTAKSAETGPGRASAALVYALTKSGDLPAAKSELEKISSAIRPHPLVNELREFVKRYENAKDAGVDEEVPTVDPSKLPAITESPGPVAAGDTLPSGDFRVMLTQANTALKAGKLDRAEQLFRAVLAKQPGNTEALAGLGDVAARKKDTSAASEAYDEVLKKNPNYIPALLGKADQKWSSGDKAGAVGLYQRVLENAGPGTPYGQKAAARIAEYNKAKAAGTAEPAPTSEPTAKPTATATATAEKPDEPQTPHIDTTDLPE